MTSSRRPFAILAWLMLMIIALAMGPARAQEPVVQMLFFYSQTCLHCEKVLEEVIPPLRDKYGDGMELRMLDVGDPASRWLQFELEGQIGVPAESRGRVPTIFIGPSIDGNVQGALLGGSKNIAAELDSIIQQDLDAGGAPLPFPLDDILEEMRQLLTATAEPTPEPEPQEPLATSTPRKEPLATPTATTEPRLIHIAYFAEPGSPECARAKYDLNLLVHRYPQVKVTSFDISQDTDLDAWLEEQTGVPLEKRGITPAIFVGHSYLVGDEVNYANLRALVGRYQAVGALPLWEKWAAERSRVRRNMVQLFHSFDPTTVLATGLKDGLSPCALATIIFLLACLALSGRKGGEAILMGGTFSLGVSLTRVIVGLGLLKALEATKALALGRRGVYGFTAFLCFTQASLALYDCIRAHRGWSQGMHLRIGWPIHSLIGESARAPALALAALALGFGISLPGVLCKGQMYLPTTIIVMGMPELRVRATLYLLLYSLAFILPLITFLCLSFLGTTSQRLRLFITRQSGIIKVLIAGLFFLLGAWLIMMV